MTSHEITADSNVITRNIETGDKVWFQRKPGRKYRVRAPVVGELVGHILPPAPPGTMPAVAVRKHAPKVRHRIVGHICRGRYPHSEKEAKRIFEAMARNMEERDPLGVMRIAEGLQVAAEMLRERQ